MNGSKTSREQRRRHAKQHRPYQPKTGAKCGCKRGIERDNCANCEGTGWVIDFRAIREWKPEPPPIVASFTLPETAFNPRINAI
jgi:hypothetical protein